MDGLEQQIQALVFASEQGIRVEEILFCLQQTDENEITEDDVLTALEQIRTRYADQSLAIHLVKVNNGYQFLTKAAYHSVINQLELNRAKKKLSQAALETLAIIAYRQPVTKIEVEQIRGVNCDYTIQKLLERELIVIAGKANTAGRPVLYETSKYFADYFGINHFNELPKLKDLETSENTIGIQQE